MNHGLQVLTVLAVVAAIMRLAWMAAHEVADDVQSRAERGQAFIVEPLPPGATWQSCGCLSGFSATHQVIAGDRVSGPQCFKCVQSSLNYWLLHEGLGEYKRNAFGQSAVSSQQSAVITPHGKEEARTAERVSLDSMPGDGRRADLRPLLEWAAQQLREARL